LLFCLSCNFCSIQIYKGSLPQQEQPEVVHIQRQFEVQERQKEYKWRNKDTLPHFPGSIDAKEHDDIPKNSQFSYPSKKSFNTGRIHAGVNLGITHLMTLFQNWDELKDFKEMYTGKIYER
jgi:hypothetical protein